MKSFFRSFFATLLALIVLVALASGAAFIKMKQKPKIKDHSYLVVDVYGEILEYNPPDGMIAKVFGGEPETLHRILTNLEKARVDERIEGIIVKISGSNAAGLAKLEEMREAIKRVRESGKMVYAFSDGMNRGALYLASACDSIFMPPLSDVVFTGLAAGRPHIKRSLDKLGIKPNIHKIKDYKSAAELVTREDMSPQAREMTQWILDEYWEMLLEAISEDRGIAKDRLVELMNHALFIAEEAKAAGLIDGILYWEELENRLKQEKDKKLRTVTQSRYAQVKPEKLGLKGKKKIAVVHAQGMIGGRKSQIHPLFGVVMGHESVVADLRCVRLDKDVAAVVFRVDSPGGEGLASDLIGHEVEALSRKKPIVVSMVDVAASGGYDIAYRATKIVADPTTITGSIGSISGKFNMKGFYDKLGITYDFVTKGPMALLFSDYRDFTEKERERFEENHWNFFNAWLRDVAEHRGMSFEEAEKLAHGRVWTGRQGKENGLVDELGGLERAIEVAKELAEIPPEEKVAVLHYPKEKGLLSGIFGRGSLGAAARWLLYSFVRDNALGSLGGLWVGPVRLADDILVK